MLKFRLEQRAEGPEEVVIRYKKMNADVRSLVDFLEGQDMKLAGRDDSGLKLLPPEEIYYFEYVDDKVFAYTRSRLYQVDQTLGELEQLLGARSFFRCSKSLIVNVQKIRQLKSMMGSRIDVQLDNDEHIVISRHYAGAFREMLKGGFHGKI